MIAGVDEVGRGAWIGNVVCAAVILPEHYDLPYLTDSKKLTPKRREVLFDLIVDCALDYAIGRASAKEVDSLNIHQATLLAMKRCVEGLRLLPQKVLIDGKYAPSLSIPTQTIIGGDGKEDCIAAASILAKVTRDREMLELDTRYPQYGFASHKGYGTKAHLQALQTHGVLGEHRHSYAPIRALL